MGDIAGYKNPEGYRTFPIDGRNYRACRLAFLFMTGSFPTELADHADRWPSNDTWENLRPATPSQNAANRRVRRDCKSGMKGAHYERKSGRYRAVIWEGGQKRHLGVFDSALAAHEVYKAAAKHVFGKYACAG
jgi:hypothetical protein